MPQLEAQLTAAITGINASFERARNDLMRLAKELSEAVAHASGGEFAIVLGKTSENQLGAHFVVSIKDGSGNPSPLVFYFIPAIGYPVQAGSTPGNPMPNATIIHDDEKLEQHFVDLVTNPSSPLVVRLAYLARAKAG